jgi:hypothetical protein
MLSDMTVVSDNVCTEVNYQNRRLQQDQFLLYNSSTALTNVVS